MNLQKIIYCLYDPDKKYPVYVGKTKNGIKRPWEHIEGKSHSAKVNEWVLKLKEIGEKPVIVVLDSTEGDDKILSAKEEFWIQKLLSDGYPLLNMTYVTAGYFFMVKNYDDNDPLKYIRTFIYNKRKQLKLTQVELAQKAGVGIRFVRELEQGKKNTFQIDKIQTVLNLFGGVLTINNVASDKIEMLK